MQHLQHFVFSWVFFFFFCLSSIWVIVHSDFFRNHVPDNLDKSLLLFEVINDNLPQFSFLYLCRDTSEASFPFSQLLVLHVPAHQSKDCFLFCNRKMQTKRISVSFSLITSQENMPNVNRDGQARYQIRRKEKDNWSEKPSK